MANTVRALEERGLGATQRRDAWWLQPVAVAAGLGAFVIYSTWAALQGNNYEWGPYLSPFYSPLLGKDWWPFSPAFLILWAPAGFRATCYYYRKAYYRAFFADPPACAVGEIAEHRYCGETKFPFILQNMHRFFFYVALLLLVFLWHDAYKSFFFENGIGIGLGSLVLTANASLLSFYTLGCHSLRHFVGGKLDTFQVGGNCTMRHSCWKGVTRLNEHHMLWAWCSLVMVGFADFYVRMLASGIFTDLRLL
ncbi:MAG: succinate dehydrogenase [Acidobacteria bacterium RIFCSPLOWO2_12_FULL_54_10]|nr:MAG: succinate dehydrogenase [Acidobacteria bacterium RIFCSPLOWO2_12_FULL_54_10]